MNKQEVTNNITVPNTDIEILKKHFSHCFDKNGNFNFKKFKDELSEDKIKFSNESYSMNWLGKSYARVLASEKANTLLKEDEQFNNKEENKDSKNLLIKGDNIEVLKHLSNAYHEKVKMIYIDPPYNTGSDGFVYNDDRKFSVKEFKQLAGVDEEEAKRILDFVDSKSNSHSAWLTFMYPRLYIAKQLLKDDGVIFISIDDNEVAQLSMLMSNIFGDENIDSMIWRKAGIGRDGKMKNTTTFRKDHEYILIGYKNIHELNKSLEKPNWINSYGNPDNDTRGNYKAGSISRKEEASNKNSKNYYSVISPSGKKFTRQFDIPKEKFILLCKDNRIYWGKNGDAVPAIKIFENEKREVNTSSIIFKQKNVFKSSLYEDNEANTTSGSKELNRLIQKNDIGEQIRPKPSKLIRKIIQIGSNSNSIVLDFFAGSGTTGDALMQLNAEDGGNRKYILVQLPEEIDPKKSKTAYDFVKNELNIEKPTIFDITKERLIRASKKIKEDNKNSKEPKDLSYMDFGFKVFETTPIWEDFKIKEDEFNEQIKLFQESRLTNDDLKTLLTTWKTYDGIPLQKNLKEIDFDGYKGHYINNKVYLVYKEFTTQNLKKLIEEIDSNKDFNPALIIAFGYNFDSKSLREIAENIKNYTNKKNIDIDFITRY